MEQYSFRSTAIMTSVPANGNENTAEIVCKTLNDVDKDIALSPCDLSHCHRNWTSRTSRPPSITVAFNRSYGKDLVMRKSIRDKLKARRYNIHQHTELNKVMDSFKLNKLLLNYKKSQYIFFGPHYPIQYKSEFLLQDLYEVCPDYLLLSEKYTDLEEQLADDSLQRVYVKGEPLLKDLYEVAPYYTTREHIVTNQGILIEQDEVKYLGIIFDNILKFTTHINNITQKIGKVVGVLWKGRSLPLCIKLKIYYSLIYSHLNFAILLWGSIISKNINGSTEFEHVPKQLKKGNTAHNKAVRALVCARKRDPLSKIFRELLKLIDIYYYNLGVFAYQTFTKGCPHFFDNYAISHNKPA